MTPAVLAGMLAPMSKHSFTSRELAVRLAAWFTFRLASLLSRLPLRLLHGIGTGFGLLVVGLDRGFRAQIVENLEQAGSPARVRDVAMEMGKGFLEIAVAWCRPSGQVASLVVDVDGWQHVEAARAAGQGIIWLTPHLGSYDIGGRYISLRTPVLAMYRPPKMAWLEPLMNAGRQRDAGTVARADMSGVRLMLKTLKDGGSIIVLPDQVPSGGDGVWAPFFGKPAYTMTLVPRLALSTEATVLLFYCERLPAGRGFRLCISPLRGEFTNNKAHDAAIVNANVEDLILAIPAQYLWSYRRYKAPSGSGGAPTL